MPIALETLHAQIEAIQAQQSSPSPVRVVAVSKEQPDEAIQALANQGQIIFAENKAHHLAARRQAFAHLPHLEWHFIGRIQTNKVALIASHADWVQSVYREKEAKALNHYRASWAKPLSICLQVDLSDNPNKAGLDELADIKALAHYIVKDCPNLKLRGLMAIPDLADSREQFTAIHQLYQTLKADIPMDTLSMGMSQDYEAALLCGSNMIRIGTALFGPRPTHSQ